MGGGRSGDGLTHRLVVLRQADETKSGEKYEESARRSSSRGTWSWMAAFVFLRRRAWSAG